MKHRQIFLTLLLATAGSCASSSNTSTPTNSQSGSTLLVWGAAGITTVAIAALVKDRCYNRNPIRRVQTETVSETALTIARENAFLKRYEPGQPQPDISCRENYLRERSDIENIFPDSPEVKTIQQKKEELGTLVKQENDARYIHRNELLFFPLKSAIDKKQKELTEAYKVAHEHHFDAIEPRPARFFDRFIAKESCAACEIRYVAAAKAQRDAEKQRLIDEKRPILGNYYWRKNVKAAVKRWNAFWSLV